MVTSETIIEDPNTNHFDFNKITEYPDANYIDSDEVSGKNTDTEVVVGNAVETPHGDSERNAYDLRGQGEGKRV